MGDVFEEILPINAYGLNFYEKTIPKEEECLTQWVISEVCLVRV
jgi:hypothetical protein